MIGKVFGTLKPKVVRRYGPTGSSVRGSPGGMGRLAVSHRTVLLLLLLAVLLLTLAACAPEEEETLSGPFGPGSGGQDPLLGTPTQFSFNKAGGGALGSLKSDTSYFPQVVLPGTVVVMASGVDPVTLVVTRISGRADTPCRYAAALDARDDGFVILESGERSNAKGLAFYQVNLVGGSTYHSYYCTLLRDKVGIMIWGRSTGGNRLGNLQVHYVLNSVSP